MKYNTKYYNNANTTRFEMNNVFYRRVAGEIEKSENTRFFGINEYHKDELLRHKGKQSFTMIAGSERRKFYVWVCEYEFCNIIILTNTSYGTV